MSADMLAAPATGTAGTDDVLTAAATVWATLSVLDELELNPEARTLADSAHRHLVEQLDRAGIDKADLYEHIVSAVDAGDWLALGLGHRKRSVDGRGR
jgi:hypothetical protein